MSTRAFLMLVGPDAVLSGFTPASPEQVAMALRGAGEFYNIHCEGGGDQRELYRCLNVAVERDVITFLREDKGARPVKGDTTIAMHWRSGAREPSFYTSTEPVAYTPKPSLPPPPID